MNKQEKLVDDILQGMVGQSQEANPAETDSADNTSVATDEVANNTETEETSPLDDEEEVVENVSETEVNEEVSTDEDGATEDDGVFSDWDDQEDDTPVENKEIISEISKAIGLESSNTEDIVNEFNSIKSENEQLKAQIEQNPYEGLPESLTEAIQVAKEGGDFLEYLGIAEVDYSGISDEDLLISQVRPYFSEGETGDEEAKDWIDSMNDAEIKIQAGRLRQTLNEEMESRKHAIKQRTQQQKEEQNQAMLAEKQKLRESIESLDSIADFKLTKSHKNRIYEDISNGKISTELFGFSEGKQADYKKMAETYFKARYFDKIVSYLRSSTANQTKKKILEETSNANLNGKGSHVTPSEKSGLDLFINSFR